MNHLPRLSRAISLTRHADHSIHFSPVLAEVALLESGEVYARMRTTPEGLNEDEAAKRWAEVGPNVVAANDHHGWPWRLLTAVRNPLVTLLGVLAAISFATGDARAGGMMTLMVILGILLRLVQETRADAAAEKLKAMIKVTAGGARRQGGGDPAQATGAWRCGGALGRGHDPGGRAAGFRERLVHLPRHSDR
jgi:Mg2+-importing ATPase